RAARAQSMADPQAGGRETFLSPQPEQVVFTANLVDPVGLARIVVVRRVPAEVLPDGQHQAAPVDGLGAGEDVLTYPASEQLDEGAHVAHLVGGVVEDHIEGVSLTGEGCG